MKAILTAVGTAAGVAALALPAAAEHNSRERLPSHHYAAPSGGVVVVSCFRGPLTETIWDRPAAIFVDSLVAVGYVFPTAHAIAERICRDVALVQDTAGLRAEMERILRQYPGWRS
jgi:hypothetical protein